MMKSSELVLLVESVEDAIKFYTEKLGFDIVTLRADDAESSALTSAQLRKGKCFISFRVPQVEELAEFSYIKRCAGRGVSLFVEMKKGIKKYFDRCQKKGLRISTELRRCSIFGDSFSLRDPFGVKLIFSQPVEGKAAAMSFEKLLGAHLTSKIKQVAAQQKEIYKNEDLIDNIVDQLKNFGILRRFAKKYAKIILKIFEQK